MISECQIAMIWMSSQVLGVSSRSKLFAYGTSVVIGRLRVNLIFSTFYFFQNVQKLNSTIRNTWYRHIYHI